eukprot:6116025-Amphidinium_carterae.1
MYRDGDACSAPRLEFGLQWSLRFLDRVLKGEPLDFSGDSLTVSGNKDWHKPSYMPKRMRTGFQLPEK